MKRLLDKVALIWNRHKQIICFVVLFLFLAGLALYIFKTTVYPASKDPYAAIEVTGSETPSDQLRKGDVWKQTFLMKSDEVSGVSIKIGTYQRINSGEFQVVVRNLNSDAILYDQKLAMGAIKDNEYQDFLFDQPVKDVNGEQFEITIKVLSASPQDQISIWMSKSDQYPDGISDLNGIQADGDAIFKVYSGDNSFLNIIFIIATVIVLLSLCAAYYFIFIKKVKLTSAFVFLAAFLGLAYSFMMIPMSIPDEQAHIETSYRYSDQMMFLGHQTENGHLLMRQDDKTILDNLKQTPTPKLYKYVAENFFQACKDSTLVEVNGRDVDTSRLVYFPTAIGITIGRLLNLGFIPVLYLGRLFNFIFYVILVFLALKKLPIGKMILFTVALLPMSIHQAASFSTDAVIMAVSFYFIACVVKMAYGEEKVDLADIVLLCFFGSWLTLFKSGAYMALCFLTLLIPAKQFKSKKQHIITKSAISFLAIALFVLNTLLPILFADGGGDSVVPWSGLPPYTLGWILHNPFGFIRILITTFIDYFDFYIHSLIGGSLGWLNIGIPNFVGIAFIVLLLISCLKVDSENQLVKASHKFWIVLVLFAVAICTEVGLFISWTPIDSSIIEGVQGRYFLPILPALLLLFRNSNITLKRDMSKYIMIAVCFLNILELALAFRVIV